MVQLIVTYPSHKEATRNNLIKENYPKELLQDFHWWMSGVKDSEQNIVKKKKIVIIT